MQIKKLNELTFEITQQCPNNCIYCSSNSNIKCNNQVDFTLFKNVIDDAIKLGMKNLYISGGEPLLHNNLLEMICYVKKYNIQIYIYTSGIIKKKDGKYYSISNDVLIKLKDLGLDKLIFNVQSADEKLYNTIMQTNNCFTLLTESIKRSISLNIYTEIHFVPMKLNINKVYEVIAYAKNLGVNKISFLRLVTQGRAEQNKSLLEISNEDLNNFRSKILLQKNTDIEMRLGIPLSNEKEHSYCSAGWGKIVIKYNGDVLPCEAFKYVECIKRERLIFPDNINKNSLMYIWRNSEFLNILRKDIQNLCENPKCEKCPAVQIRKENTPL